MGGRVIRVGEEEGQGESASTSILNCLPFRLLSGVTHLKFSAKFTLKMACSLCAFPNLQHTVVPF